MARSKIAEMVEEEAARAEAETEDEDEGAEEDEETEDEDETEGAEEEGDEAAAEWEPLSMEAVAAKIEEEGHRHSAALAAIFGPEYEAMEACPLCHMLGVVAPESPVIDPLTQRCERCKGWGQLVTEASNPEHRFRQCPECMGNGYVPRVETPPAEAAVPVAVPPMPVYDPATNTWSVPVEAAPAPTQGGVAGAVTSAA